MRAPTFMDRIAGAARAFAEPRPAPSGSVGKELGTPGTDIWHGQIDVEYKTELRGGCQGKRWDTYQRMESDGMVAMVLRVIALPIKAAVWRVQPGVGADQRGIEAAEFCTEVINAMRPKWEQFLSEAGEYWGDGLRLVGSCCYVLPLGRIGGSRLAGLIGNHGDNDALRDLIADLHAQCLYHAGDGRGDFHGRLIAFERD